MTLRLALRAVAGLAAVALAVVLALAATDVLRWRGQTARASVELDARSYDPHIWAPRTVLPVGLSEWLLGTGDDVAFGRGLQLFRLLRSNRVRGK